MARAGPVPGTWICPWCERIMPESDFSLDAYRKRHGKGPGRCRECDREYARAKTALSPTGKYGDVSHSEAYWLAKDTCSQHSWGKGYYTMTDKAAVKERAGRVRDADRRAVGVRGLAAGERRVAEAVMVQGAERKRVREYREQDAAIAARLAEPKPAAVPVRADDPYKAALREWRQTKKGPPPRRADYE